MNARVPQDVDLEDRLIYGLSPVRFGYLAVGALAAYVLAAHTGVAGVLRMPGAVLLLGVAAAVAWVRWRGRSLDAWALDLAIYARRNLEVRFEPPELSRVALPRPPRLPKRRRRGPAVARLRVPTITVVAERPGAGATTVAVELGAALALKGRRVAVTQAGGPADAATRLGLSGPGRHERTGLIVADLDAPEPADCVVVDLGSSASYRKADLALLVAAEPTAVESAPRRVPRAAHMAVVVNRDRDSELARPSRTGLELAAVVPEDSQVPTAQEAREPVILKFPSSRAAQAFRQLAERVDPSRPAPWQRPDSDQPQAG